MTQILKGLMRTEMIECLTPDLRMGRIYRITDLGKIVIDTNFKKLNLIQKV